MQNNSTPEPAPPSGGGTETVPQLASQPQVRTPTQRPDTSQIAQLLQQQGTMPAGINLADPAQQAHVFHVLSQMGATQGGWGGSSQPSNSQPLESLLATLSRQPEIAANLPNFLSNLSGSLGQSIQPKNDTASQAQPDALQNFSAQLYNATGSGLNPEDAGKMDLSGELGAGTEDDPGKGGVKCAKEKNRQAQRRFRERQKGLIQSLKDRSEILQKQVDDFRRQIETLEKENQVLKVILQEKKT